MTTPALFDPGLQPERTLLAWRRTCLSAAVADAVLLRLTAPTVGPAGLAAGLVALALLAGGWLALTVRYRRVSTALRADPDRLVADGVPIAAVATSTAILAGMCLAALLTTQV